MDALALLIRLARLRLDEERRSLAALGAREQALDAERQALRDLRRRERAAVGPELEANPLLWPWLTGLRRREGRLAAEGSRLDAARQSGLARLLGQRAEIERLELVAARRRQQEEAATTRREQRALDDLVGGRAARTRSRGAA